MIVALVKSLKSSTLFKGRQLLMMAAITVGYMLLSYLLIGFRPEQVFLISMVNILYFASVKTRKFVIGFSVFIVYWVLFDYMKAFPNYKLNAVYIADLYAFEKNWFGILYNGAIITPNEYWLLHNNTFLDILTGFFYLTWVPVPLLFGGYLFARYRKEFFHFAFSFLVINLVGFVVYYTYPAAPPWYVQNHGFSFEPGTLSNTAGLSRFDAFFGVEIFKSLYAKGSNVFAAMPSLHSAYPTLVLYYGLRNRLGYINVIFATIMVGVWFAAVYTSHHYIADVVAGIVCAVVGIVFYNALTRTAWLNRFINKMVTNTVI